MIATISKYSGHLDPRGRSGKRPGAKGNTLRTLWSMSIPGQPTSRGITRKKDAEEIARLRGATEIVFS